MFDDAVALDFEDQASNNLVHIEASHLICFKNVKFCKSLK